MTGNCIASRCVIVSVGGASLTLRQAPVAQASVAVSTTATGAGSPTAGSRKTTNSAACRRGAGGGAS